jgi:hypothetical protein
VKKGGTVAADAFYGGPVARAERKKGRGGGVRCHVEGKMGKRERASGTVGDSSMAGISSRPTDAGSAIAARQGRATGRERRGRERLTGGTGRRRGPVGSAWVREGMRESEAAAASGR